MDKKLKELLNRSEKEDLISFIINNNYTDEYNQFLKNKNIDNNNTKQIEIYDELKNKEIKILKGQLRLNFQSTKHFAFKFGYIGKNYEGLVIQKHTDNTIEDKIIKSLKKANLIENIESCNYSRCGRTDAGVSAVGNVFSVTLRYKENIDYVKVLNNLLPKDIRIFAYTEVDESFDARFSCLYREYNYYFFKKDMNIDKIKQAAQKLIGLKNFKNFCKIDKNEKVDKNFEYNICSFRRRIFKFSIEKVDKIFSINNNSSGYLELYVAVIQGSAFLWHQVRCMMAILFLIGNGLEDISLIDIMLNKEYLENRMFNYQIASDIPLILTNCQYEGITFENNVLNLNEIFLNLREILEKNLIDICVTSRMLNSVGILYKPFYTEKCVPNKKEESIWEFIENDSKYPKRKYTQLLNIKRNKNN